MILRLAVVVVAHTTSSPTTSHQNEGVLAAVNKLTKLVEGHPQLYSKLERMLQNVCNELELEVSAAVRKQEMKILVQCTNFQMMNTHLWTCRGNAVRLCCMHL